MFSLLLLVDTMRQKYKKILELLYDGQLFFIVIVCESKKQRLIKTDTLNNKLVWKHEYLNNECTELHNEDSEHMGFSCRKPMVFWS